jgi:excisionase family DNA binding protein
MIKNLTNSDPLYTTAEAENYLGTKPGVLTVWRSTKRYNIPHLKIGRLVRYRKSALDNFLSRCTVGADSEA